MRMQFKTFESTMCVFNMPYCMLLRFQKKLIWFAQNQCNYFENGNALKRVSQLFFSLTLVLLIHVLQLKNIMHFYPPNWNVAPMPLITTILTTVNTWCSSKVETIVGYDIVLHSPIPGHELNAMTTAIGDTVRIFYVTNCSGVARNLAKGVQFDIFA